MAEKSDKKVTVEMTEAQKEKVLDVLSKDEEQKEPVRMAKVELALEHERNNVKYGPGWVQVEAGIAASLLAADQKAIYARLAESQMKDSMVQILGRGITRKVQVIQ